MWAVPPLSQQRCRPSAGVPPPPCIHPDAAEEGAVRAAAGGAAGARVPPAAHRTAAGRPQHRGVNGGMLFLNPKHLNTARRTPLSSHLHWEISDSSTSPPVRGMPARQT